MQNYRRASLEIPLGLEVIQRVTHIVLLKQPHRCLNVEDTLGLLLPERSTPLEDGLTHPCGQEAELQALHCRSHTVQGREPIPFFHTYYSNTAKVVMQKRTMRDVITCSTVGAW